MLPLKPFAPLSPSVAVEAKALREGAQLIFEFKISDPTGAVQDKPYAGRWNQWGRADGLWRSTCFEVFLGRFGDPGYWEFNFSPVRLKWNVYRFENYREPQPPTVCHDFTLTEVQASSTSLKCALLPAVGDSQFECSLTAVIRASSETGFFALMHAGPTPDFHKRDSFILRI